jgi:hypothetical protein
MDWFARYRSILYGPLEMRFFRKSGESSVYFRTRPASVRRRQRQDVEEVAGRPAQLELDGQIVDRVHAADLVLVDVVLDRRGGQVDLQHVLAVLVEAPMVALKYPGVGFGQTGLHSRLKPSTTTFAVNWRGPSSASQLAPSLIRNV